MRVTAPASSSTRLPSFDARTALQGALFTAPCIGLGLAAWTRRWTTDDAFINYRIIDQIFAGHGPVYNTGERVEAATSTVWLAVLALGRVALPFSLEYVAIALSITLAGIGVLSMNVAARRLLTPAVPSGAVVWVPAGSLALVSVAAVWDFTTSGLETGLTLAWVGSVALVVSRGIDEPETLSLRALALVGLGPLVRPDEAITTAVVLAYLLAGTFRRGHVGRAAAQLAAAVSLPLAYELFRMGYYASLVPNTALAKQAGSPHWQEGWAYLVDFTRTYALYLPVLFLVVAAVLASRSISGRRRMGLAALPAAAVVQAAFLIRAGGDYMHARLLLPALFALVAPVAVLPLRRSLAALPIVGLALWAGLSIAHFRAGEPRAVRHTIIADGRRSALRDGPHPVTAADLGWGPDSPGLDRLRKNAVTVEQVAVDVTPPADLSTPAAAMYGIGVTGYAAGIKVHVIDRLGLADAVGSRFVVTSPGFVGHEKPIPDAWLAARISTEGNLVSPDVLATKGFVRPLYESPPGQLEGDSRAARSAARCKPLRVLMTATEGTLTPARWLSNLVRAPGLTRLTIPAAPEAARAQLC